MAIRRDGLAGALRRQRVMHSPAQDGVEAGSRQPAERAALEELRTAIRDTSRLTRLFTILSEPAQLTILLDRVLSTLSELFSSDLVVLLQQAGPGELSLVSAIGLPEDLLHEPFSGAEGGCAAAALRSRTPVLVPSARSDARVERQFRELDVETAVWLPILGSQAVLGVLVLARCQPVPFLRADVDLLMAMAYRIGLVLERARSEEEQERLEARLRQAEKAESLGRMAGAIAHNFNNTLSAVMGSLDLALDDLAPEHEARKEIVHALEATRQAAKVSGLMLAYLGQGAQARDPLELTATCGDVVARLTASLPANVRLRTAFPTHGLWVRANEAQFRQVLTNLVTNAWEALPITGGEVTVAVRAEAASRIVPSAFPAPDWTPKADPYACLEVSDTGRGMDAATLRNAFDPFFTTKSAGRGLGLPVALGVVRAHEGTVAVESELCRGTTFRVYLPLLMQAPPLAPCPERPAPQLDLGHGLALVVDDEPMIRRCSKRILNRMGYEVVTATDGVEALELFRHRPADVRFVLLDLSMPRMDGWETLAAIWEVRPGTPVILNSGHDEAFVLNGEHRESSVVFLQKPFESPALHAAIEKALAVQAQALP